VLEHGAVEGQPEVPTQVCADSAMGRLGSSTAALGTAAQMSNPAKAFAGCGAKRR